MLDITKLRELAGLPLVEKDDWFTGIDGDEGWKYKSGLQMPTEPGSHDTLDIMHPNGDIVNVDIAFFDPEMPISEEELKIMWDEAEE